jgi:outer membrane protein assembly factor BamB
VAGVPGSRKDGLALASNLPERWSARDHVTWAVDVPGQGWSSPIVANGTVYVTSAISGKPFKQPTPGIYGNDYIAELRAAGLSSAEVNRRLRARDNEVPEESDAIRYLVYAFDARTGALRWEREAYHGLPIGGRHRKNTYASETPFTDGERIYVSFGLNIGLFCYALDGTLLWKRTWPPQPIYLDFGTGSSPIVHAGRVYVLQDSERESFLAALDAKTGADVWRVPRTEKSTFNRTSSWSTPRIWNNSIRTEIVTTGHGFIQSYGLDGRELWRIARVSMPLASPVTAGDILFVGTGAQEGEAARPFFAINAGASGDITLTGEATSSASVRWRHPRASGYTPSPLVHQGRVYPCTISTMLVLSADTGQKSIVPASAAPTRSPHAGCHREPHLFFRRGRRHGRLRAASYREVAQNDLGAMTRFARRRRQRALHPDRQQALPDRVAAPRSTSRAGSGLFARLLRARRARTSAAAFAGTAGRATRPVRRCRRRRAGMNRAAAR